MNKKPKFIITLFSILIGFSIAIQMKSNVAAYVPATVASLNELNNDKVMLDKEIEELIKSIELKETELETLKNISTSDKDIVELLEKDILQNRMKSGHISLEGSGVKIIMYDNPEERSYDYDINEDVIHDIDLFRIVNDLRIAGAEAISINGERVITNSEIKCGGPIVRINDKSSGTPFVVHAIGDSQKLMAAVTAPGTYGYILKNIHEKGFETERKDVIQVIGHNKLQNYKYAKPMGEEN